jgi:small-conductance mechanosensitive channel
MNIPTLPADPVLAFVSILAIILVTLIITRLIAFSMNRMKRFKKDMTAIYLIRDIITYVIYFIALMVIMQFFGINLAGTLLSVGIVGIAVSFAAKDIISNLFSGIILIIGKSIKVGDTIEVDGKKGYVERISLRSTIVVDDVGVKNIVPNSILTNNEYQLYKEPEIFRVDIIVGLPFNIDLENFRNYIIEKMGEYDEIADNPRPDVYAKEILFKESRVKVSFWIKDFNNKDKYKIIISNEIRKFINMGENNE